MSSESGTDSNEFEQPTLPPHTEKDKDVAPTLDLDKTSGVQGKPSTADAAEVPAPQLDDYEILGELGRGGMGVVYKARQKKLDRTVALKMILGGQFASETEVRRFQLEAESAAKLDHPGIVPIYETGQAAGNHFFSMKFVEGKSLSELLDDYQEETRQTAELMIKIAHAVHHAHERGVLHRDLKPANILIDQSGEPAITDLGLAKQIDDESGLTHTGLVMGSPGFMSPEQAKGRTDTTTAVDIYSLGAILYWLVAGRPPFQGETLMETILQTIDKEAESVRVYRPDADKDLNLICQKALQKRPEDRYASALEFANDLQAWLDGEPLSVKPPSTIDLARIWVRKNFRTVSLAMGSGILCGFLIGGIVFSLIVYNNVEQIEGANRMLGVDSAPWVVKYFGWIRQIPVIFMVALPPSIVWINVFFGILMIGLIKPRSREIGLVAATSGSLLAGIIAYSVSLGWYPVADNSVDKGRHDIELLADAMWLETNNEKQLAQAALLKKYPGLEHLEPNQRGYLVYHRIIKDQEFGIPGGMWIGIWTTLCLSVLPLFFSTAFSSSIWNQGNRKFSYVGKSIEVGIYSGLFFLMLSKYVTRSVGVMPGFWIQLLTLGGVALTLYLALTDKKWPWRVFGFMLANFCVFLNFYESFRVDNARSVLAACQTEDEIESSAYLLRQRIQQRGDQFDRFLLAIYMAYSGNDEEYGRQCAALFEGFENIFKPNIAERLVKVSLLKPDQNSLDNEKLAIVHELAELVSGYESSYDAEWLYFARALSELRKNDARALDSRALDDGAEVFKWNQRCRDHIQNQNKKGRELLVCCTHIVDALAQQEDISVARQLFTKTTAGTRKEHTSIDALIFKIFEREYIERFESKMP